jgi:FkbM family methyltransferase
MRSRIKTALKALLQRSKAVSDKQKSVEVLAEKSSKESFTIFKNLNVNGKIFRLRGDTYLERMKLGFEPGLTHLFNTIAGSVKPGSCLDVGANIGITAHLLAGLYTHVYCFEASPRTYKILEENLITNNIKNVTTFPFGLGKESKTFTLTAANNDASGGFLSEDLSADLEGHTKEAVEISKGDDILESIQEIDMEPIRFIKLDIEGHELEALTGLIKTLEKHNPVVVLEMNHWCLNAFKRLSIPEFLETLDTYFPAILAFDDSKHELIDISAGRDSGRYHVMHEHIVHNRFPTLISSRDIETLNRIKTNLSRQRD